MLRAAGTSSVGPAHLQFGQPNQDALGLWGWKTGWIAVVCDGLGSRPLSHVGSRLACLAARRVIRNGADWGNPRQVIEDIGRMWLETLPISPAQAATTVLIAACRANGECFVAQLGDGLILCRSEGEFSILTSERDGFANQTKALGSSESWLDWRISRPQLVAPGDGIMMMTDGISDDLRTDLLESFFHMMQKECRGRTSRRAKKWLQAQLEGWPTPGHSDDKTVAMIFVNQNENTRK